MSTKELSSEPKDPPLEVLRELSTKIHTKLIELLTVFTKFNWWNTSNEATAHQKDVLDLIDKAIALGRFASHSRHLDLLFLMEEHANTKEESRHKDRRFYHYIVADRMKTDLQEKMGTFGEMKSKEEIVKIMLESVDLLSDAELLISSMEDCPEKWEKWEERLCWEQIRTLCLLPLHFIQPQNMKSDELHRLEESLRRHYY